MTSQRETLILAAVQMEMLKRGREGMKHKDARDAIVENYIFLGKLSGISYTNGYKDIQATLERMEK